MTAPNVFREAMRLGRFIELLPETPRWTWLYITDSVSTVTLDTLCLPTATASRDLSNEELEEFDAYATRNGLRPFLCHDQVRDIIQNLRLQRPEFTQQQLSAALDHYWRHDAFIDLTSG
jgi:hypothetical protein